MKQLTKKQLLTMIGALQNAQKANRPDTDAWRDAQEALDPLFAEMAERENQNDRRSDDEIADDLIAAKDRLTPHEVEIADSILACWDLGSPLTDEQAETAEDLIDDAGMAGRA